MIIDPTIAATVTYHGFAPDAEHPVWRVFQVIGDVEPKDELEGGPFCWGKGRPEDMANPTARASVMAGGKNLAMALCLAALGGNEDMAAAVATRFQWRTVAGLNTGSNFTLRHSDVVRTIREIAQAAEGNQQIAAQVSQELAPVVSERIIGEGGAVAEIERNGVPVSKIEDQDL